MDGFESQVKDFAINLIDGREPSKMYEQGIGQTSEQEDIQGEKDLNNSLRIAQGPGKDKNVLISEWLKRKMSPLKIILNKKSIFLTTCSYC